MENNQRILILNVSKSTISNKETGEVVDLCRIVYGMMCEETDRFHGYSVLESYVKPEAHDIVLKYVGKLVPYTMRMKAQKNGVKYILESLNGEMF